MTSKIGGMCMSEPNAGTDVLGMKSNAVYDATRDGYLLNGTKVRYVNRVDHLQFSLSNVYH